eukprot:gb/GEZN01005308.1/.p1 GENE.gb/GEZN01005308.1/~~gb/GEZN01005308.1/.p1  ORF type:complete len:377 (-),score=62.74 gb/GEZN01005308.1/:691-1701(-)
MLRRKWPGSRITFGFRGCPLCKAPISHPILRDLTDSLDLLERQVTQQALLRLKLEEDLDGKKTLPKPLPGQHQHSPPGGVRAKKRRRVAKEGEEEGEKKKAEEEEEGEIMDTESEGEEEEAKQDSNELQGRLELALRKFAFYQCYKCQMPYYGGAVVCAAAAAGREAEVDPKELVCSACSPIQAASCPEHGPDHVEFKCRFCCSVATWFCFGTTHFCTVCHYNSLELTSLPLNELAACPCVPSGWSLPVALPKVHRNKDQKINKQQQQQDDAGSLEQKDWCPLGVQHPPSGQEFAMGCALCKARNHVLQLRAQREAAAHQKGEGGGPADQNQTSTI